MKTEFYWLKTAFPHNSRYGGCDGPPDFESLTAEQKRFWKEHPLEYNVNFWHGVHGWSLARWLRRGEGRN